MNSNLKRNGRKRTLEELKRFNAERVILALDKYELDDGKRKTVMAELAENCRFFKENGFVIFESDGLKGEPVAELTDKHERG